jgi:hypothetical protein
MKHLVLDLPTVALVAATHAVSGVAIGMLLSERIPVSRRRTLGLTLLALGAATHIPMTMAVMRARRDGHQRLPG